MRSVFMAFIILLVLAVGMPLARGQLKDTAAISVSLVNHDPDPAVAGDVAEVRLGIQNTGGEDSKNLVVELVPGYPFSPVPGDNAVQKIGVIQGYQGYSDPQSLKIVKYRLRVDKDATAGSYELKAKYYEEGSSSSAQKSISIRVKNRESAEVIHIDKTTLLPGKQSSLRFSINNVGNAPLRDLTFNWENDDMIILPVGSDNTRYVRYIDVGENAEIEYQVIADTNAQPGLYKLNLYLNYENPANGSSKKVSTMAGVYVGGETDFDASFSESANGQTSFTVANIGSNPASSVSVIVPEQRAWRVSGSNSVIIGNLNKGDYTVASFKLQPSMISQANMNQDKAQQMPRNSSSEKVALQIAYTDTMGERRVVTKETLMRIQNFAATTSQAASRGHSMAAQNDGVVSKYKLPFAALIIAAIALLAYRKHKSNRRKILANSDFKMKDSFKSIRK